MKRTSTSSDAQLPKNTQPEEFDVVILGGGTGSTIAAWTFAGEGKRVAVVDRKYIGGSCPNIACLPSKNIIHSAKIASYFRRGKEFGINHDGFTIDMAQVRDRKRKMVSGLNEMYLENYRNTGAVLILGGSGRFVAPRRVEVALPDGSNRQLRGTNVIVSTGTRAAMPAISGLAEAKPLTHIEALELDEVPEHLLMIGGGYIGIELSQAMRRFGSEVSVIDPSQRLMTREDGDVCEALRSLLEDEGIAVHLDAQIKRVMGTSGKSVSIVFEQKGAEKTVRGSHVLVATGRTPNTGGLGLELAGIELTDRGYIKVNERLQTTAPGVWASGSRWGAHSGLHRVRGRGRRDHGCRPGRNERSAAVHRASRRRLDSPHISRGTDTAVLVDAVSAPGCRYHLNRNCVTTYRLKFPARRKPWDSLGNKVRYHRERSGDFSVSCEPIKCIGGSTGRPLCQMA
jgi:pyruvate/2-oxoglutarate dehydrogenase complex dihydrolipoamide dehydrogenase (E3) component